MLLVLCPQSALSNGYYSGLVIHLVAIASKEMEKELSYRLLVRFTKVAIILVR